jgi:PIN domain nuclease of toxin-antitoxin system
LLELLDEPEAQLVEVPESRNIVAAVLSISREAVPDMPDRVIAATALSLTVPVISRDGKIRDNQVETIW